MKISNLLGKASVFAGLASAAVLAQAATEVDHNDNFYEYYNTITNWAQGGLGVGLATTMLVMGGAIGVAKNSPMPTLTGVAGAAFLHFGPGIIQKLILNGYTF